MPGLADCLEGEAGLGGEAGPALGLASLVDDASSSARILSSLASRPPTAWERNEPHPVFLVGAAILDQRGHFVVVKPLGLAINEGRCVPFLQVSPSGDDAADVAQLQLPTRIRRSPPSPLPLNAGDGVGGGGVLMTTAKSGSVLKRRGLYLLGAECITRKALRVLEALRTTKGSRGHEGGSCQSTGSPKWKTTAHDLELLGARTIFIP